MDGSKSWLRGRHRRRQLRDIRADVLREELEVAALRDRAATSDRAARRITGD